MKHLFLIILFLAILPTITFFLGISIGEIREGNIRVREASACSRSILRSLDRELDSSGKMAIVKTQQEKISQLVKRGLIDVRDSN